MATDDFVVTITWTHWLDRTGMDPDWEANGVLYLYGTNTRPFYIGEAGRSTVEERFNDHKSDGVLECVSRQSKDTFNVKVGYIELPENRRLSAELLRDIQNLLIYKEAGFGNCTCNVSNTATRGASRDGMILVNLGDCTPLENRYDDDDT